MTPERSSRWSRLATELRYGAAHAAHAAAKRSLARWVEWGSVVVLDEQIVPHAMPDVGADAIVRELDRADIVVIGNARGRAPTELFARLDRGDRGFGAFTRGVATVCTRDGSRPHRPRSQSSACGCAPAPTARMSSTS